MSHPRADRRERSHVRTCRLVVVQDQLQGCPYLDDQTARMPLNLPVGAVTPDVTDELLAQGYRRSGDFVYQTRCPVCRECQPTRVDVTRFQWSRSLKRVLRNGDRDLTCRWDQPRVDGGRVRLFNRHRAARDLAASDSEVEAESYAAFLVESCCQTRELSVEHDGRLVAIAIVDFGRHSLSAVYTHFDPSAARYSPGTYCVLKQIQAAAEQSRRYVYLGMYVADNRHLNYKARFKPQERLIDGRWTAIE